MARLDDLLARRDSLMGRYLDLSRGLTRVPPGSRLSGLQPGGDAIRRAVPASATVGGAGNAVTIRPGSNAGGPLALSLGANALLPSPRPDLLAPGATTLLGSERLAGLVPGLANATANFGRGGIPATLFGQTLQGGQAVSPAILAQTAGVGPGVAPVQETAGLLATGGLGLPLGASAPAVPATAAELAAAASDFSGVAGPLAEGLGGAAAGFSPLIGPALLALPLLWGGTPLSPFPFLEDSSPLHPSAASRWRQEQMKSRAGAVTGFSGANSLEDVAQVLNQIAGRSYTGRALANPDVLRAELQGNLFDRSAGGSLPNLAMAELARALTRADPTLMPVVNPLIPQDVATVHASGFNMPFFAEGIHPEMAQALAHQRGVTITTPDGTFVPAVNRETPGAREAYNALVRPVYPAGWGPGQEAQWAMGNTGQFVQGYTFPTPEEVRTVLGQARGPASPPDWQRLANEAFAGGGAQL